MNLWDEYYLGSLLLSAGQVPEFNLGSMIVFAVMIMAIGLVSIIYPQLFWHLRVGRKIPSVPSNKLYLLVLRFGGILVVVFGLVMIYQVWRL